MPLSLARTSGANPVHPEIPIATFVPCANAGGPDISHYLCTIERVLREALVRFCGDVLARGVGGRERSWDFSGAAGAANELISVGLG